MGPEACGDAGTHDASAPAPPDYFAAFQDALRRAGLQLLPAKGPGEFLVIDHIERPRED